MEWKRAFGFERISELLDLVQGPARFRVPSVFTEELLNKTNRGIEDDGTAEWRRFGRARATAAYVTGWISTSGFGRVAVRVDNRLLVSRSP